MFRAIVLIPFFICLAYSATTDVKPPLPVRPSITDIKQQPAPLAKAVAINTLWTDVGLRKPSVLIQVKYRHNGKVYAVAPGTTVAQIITSRAPKLSWPLEKNAKYTVVMIDPDAPSRDDPTERSVSHLAPLVGGELEKNIIPLDRTLVRYNGPTPPQGSGPHRYVILVFKQTKNFDIKDQTEIRNQFKHDTNSRGGFDVEQFAQEYGLGDAVAYNYFKVETK